MLHCKMNFRHFILILTLLLDIVTSDKVELGSEYSDLEELHRSLSETLSEMQTTLHEIKRIDHTELVNQMSNQVSQLTVRVNDLQRSKDTLESKVSSLEAEMDCLMGRGDTCSSAECRNGGVLSDEGACLCRRGFSGDYCEKDLNECDSDPCLNDGECQNTYGSYACTCPIDYYGSRCQFQYNDCEPNPCDHGKCVSPGRRMEGVPHYQCICDKGWTLSDHNYTCSQDINECDDFGGYCDEVAIGCTNTEGSFTCTCPDEYFGSGRLADGGCVEIEQCDSDPCEHGRCFDKDRGFQCVCDDGWEGPTCSISTPTGWCSRSPCKNDGHCINEADFFRCECLAGYQGEYCEISAVCDRVECHNEGQCHTEDGVTYSCQCRDGFAGVHCEGRPESCEDHGCQNDGMCLPTDNRLGYMCQCQKGFQGQLCQDVVLYELSTCGLSGSSGPGQDSCSTFYQGYGDDVTVKAGIQSVYVEREGTYEITARGASGGSTEEHDYQGGYPVEVTAIFTLTTGHVRVAVGQQGHCHNFDDVLGGKKGKSVVCGGGGGTFIVTEDKPLIIAGGGGGSGDNGPGINASIAMEGTAHEPNSNAYGGSLGTGGKTCPDYGGAGGAGFILKGDDGFSHGEQVAETGGRPWPDLRGGMGSNEPGRTNHGRLAYGGFGGGGRGTWSPGGGGGYSGGAGKCSKLRKGNVQKGGGGGGSFISPDASRAKVKIANRPGSGHVRIVRINDQ